MAKLPPASESGLPAPDGDRIKLPRGWQIASESDGTTERPSTLLSSATETGISLPNTPESSSSSVLTPGPGEFPTPTYARPGMPVPPRGGAAPNQASVSRTAAQLEAVVRAQAQAVQRAREPSGWRRAVAPVAFAAAAIVVGILVIKSQQGRPKEWDVVPPAPNAILSPKEAFERVGEDVRVEFTVWEFRFSAGPSQTLYLYAADAHPQGGGFRLVVMPAVLAELGTRARLNVNALDGGLVRAHGMVTREDRYTEICINNIDQLEKLPSGRPAK